MHAFPNLLASLDLEHFLITEIENNFTLPSLWGRLKEGAEAATELGLPTAVADFKSLVNREGGRVARRVSAKTEELLGIYGVLGVVIDRHSWRFVCEKAA